MKSLVVSNCAYADYAPTYAILYKYDQHWIM